MNLIEIIRNFKDGEESFNGDRFIFKIKENEDYETYYTISFSADEEYRDIFLSVGLVYKNEYDKMYESHDGHEDNFFNEIQNGLYERLNKLPMKNILETDFVYDYLSGCLDFETITIKDIIL